MKTTRVNIPPPPPPPPPSLSVYRSSGEGNAGDVEPTDTTILGVLERQFHYITAGSEEAIVVSQMSPLRPILQDGPQCGLVALSMASQLLQDHPVSVDTLYEKAKSLQFTKKGEMFSVENMKTLAETCLQNPSSKIVRSEQRQRELVRNLLEGKPLLIPYDSDGNFEPCLKRGHAAHWAVLHGICIVLQSSCIEGTLVDITEVHSKCSRIFRIRNIIPEEVLLELAQLAESPKTSVFVYASQGKSRHVGLWELGLLLESNNNLVHFTPKCDVSEFVVPEGGVAEGLSGQVLLFT